MKSFKLILIFYLTFVFSFDCFSNTAEDNTPINLAVSNAVSGPASQLGSRLNQGANAYFTKVNKAGGINGRKVKLITLDDGYEPYKTLTNTKAFLKRADIFAFFNYVGTPTTHAVLPLIKQSNLPFLMPFTGAEFLRNPVVDTIFNLRASYFQEAQKQIEYLVKNQNITEIGLLVQADEFGTAVEEGYLLTMKEYGIKPVVVTRYRRNTQDISLALDILKAKNVKAIGFGGTYKPFAELINMAASQDFNPLFTSVSFVSSHDLFQRLKHTSRVLITEVMPDPQTCQSSICRQFIDDMKLAGVDEPDQVQFEGYMNAYVFTQTAQRCKTALTRQCFINEIKQLNLQLDVMNVAFTPANHQGLNQVYLNFYHDKK